MGSGSTSRKIKPWSQHHSDQIEPKFLHRSDSRRHPGQWARGRGLRQSIDACNRRGRRSSGRIASGRNWLGSGIWYRNRTWTWRWLITSAIWRSRGWKRGSYFCALIVKRYRYQFKLWAYLTVSCNCLSAWKGGETYFRCPGLPLLKSNLSESLLCCRYNIRCITLRKWPCNLYWAALLLYHRHRGRFGCKHLSHTVTNHM